VNNPIKERWADRLAAITNEIERLKTDKRETNKGYSDSIKGLHEKSTRIAKAIATGDYQELENDY
jgi:hypothetical protein